MIASLRGKITTIGQDHLIVEVGGLGFRVYVPAPDDEWKPGDMVSLFTYLHVRENELSLYGFPDAETLALFEMLLGVSGIGPRMALAVLSALSPQVVRQAIVQEQAEVLARVPGLGLKTARKIIFHLKDKLVAAVRVPMPPISEADAEVIAALTSLGYSVTEAQTALRAIPSDEELPLEERIRLALSYFARG